MCFFLMYVIFGGEYHHIAKELVLLGFFLISCIRNPHFLYEKFLNMKYRNICDIEFEI